MKKNEYALGTYVKRKNAWLITWEWANDRPGRRPKEHIAAILDGRFSDTRVEKIVERIFVAGCYTFFEQIKFLNNKKRLPCQIQRGIVQLDEKLREATSLPAQLPSSCEMYCGHHPFIWARLVSNIEGFIDLDGNDHLKWLEQKNRIWTGHSIEFETVPEEYIRTF